MEKMDNKEDKENIKIIGTSDEIPEEEFENSIKSIRMTMPIKRIGTSLYLRVSKDIKDAMQLEEGNLIGVRLWKIEEAEVICPNCDYKFMDYINNDPHDCPACGKEFLDIDKKEELNATNEDDTMKGGSENE